MILAVGYRTNSAKAIIFRAWATKILKRHLTKDHTINKKRISQNYDNFIKAVEQVKSLLPAKNIIQNQDILELIEFFVPPSPRSSHLLHNPRFGLLIQRYKL
ncbi:MAG: hypothetical protein GF347_00840 [Candidatus Moranbacteria bacterium]|nr:hypothetical protein [Candidatus Moranbacteria bacterium]